VLAEVRAEVTVPRARVTYHQLVPARAAADRPGAQRPAGPGHPAGLPVLMRGVVGAQPVPDGLRSGPADGGRVPVRDADSPLRHRPGLARLRVRRAAPERGPGPAWAGAPRWAFRSRPAVRRARRGCSSSSEVRPLRPRLSRPWGVAGS